jgi:hypothetical protein
MHGNISAVQRRKNEYRLAHKYFNVQKRNKKHRAVFKHEKISKPLRYNIKS